MSDGSATTPDPRSGLDAEGNWTPTFSGQRAPFKPGNTLAVGHGRPAEHGAYAVLQLTPRAAVIAEWIRRLGTHLTPEDEPSLETLALMLAQVERAAGVLGEVDEAIARGEDVDVYLGRIETRARLSQDARRWADSARRFMDDLGLTPAGRAALEERTLTVIHVQEVQEGFRVWWEIASRYVDRKRWAAFGAEVEEAIERHQSVGVRELPPPAGPTEVEDERR